MNEFFQQRLTYLTSKYNNENVNTQGSMRKRKLKRPQPTNLWASQKLDHTTANLNKVSKRYQQDAKVIHSPIDFTSPRQRSRVLKIPANSVTWQQTGATSNDNTISPDSAVNNFSTCIPSPKS